MSLFNPSQKLTLEYLPERHDLRSLEAAAAQYRQGCDLYQRAAQVVFGEGRVRAALFLIGEQPGNQEDQATHLPFVGPAGLLLDECLESAGIDRREVYVTNAS